jgi:transcriptional regulator with AAA-type ATPase domain
MLGMTDKPRGLCAEKSRALQSPVNVVLEGESGVGKEHFAKFIHRKRNWGGEFVVYDCERSLREQTRMVEQVSSPVFFEKVARLAKTDTFFIRRLDLLQGHLLARLSDFFEELVKRGTLPRNRLLGLGMVGSLQTTAGSKSLGHTQLRKFLNSLFCLKIRILPLRERKEEIPSLVERFISLFNEEQKRNVLGITSDALGLLSHYEWPDNVRELRAEIERAATLTGNYESIESYALSGKVTASASKRCSSR